MKYIVIILLLCNLCTCSHNRSIQYEINSVIDSLTASESFLGNTLSVYMEDKDRYNLYMLSNTYGPVYNDNGKIFVSDIKTINGKTVLYYLPKRENIAIEKLESIMIAENTYHEQLWYCAISKECNKKVIVQAANKNVASYEIPKIRDFTCSVSSNKASRNEIIINYVTVSKNDTTKDVNLYAHAKVYNRLQGKQLDPLLLGKLFFIDTDTTYCEVSQLPIHDYTIDDSLWIDDPDLVSRYEISFQFSEREYEL